MVAGAAGDATSEYVNYWIATPEYRQDFGDVTDDAAWAVAIGFMIPGSLPGDDALRYADDVASYADDVARNADGVPLRPGVDRGDGRDILGRFTGRSGYGADGQSAGLRLYAQRYEVTPVDTQVRATIPTSDSLGGRYYDGLARNPDGTYVGIEVKSGTATRNAHQRDFDAAVGPDSPATAVLNGQRILITSTIVIKVP